MSTSTQPSAPTATATAPARPARRLFRVRDFRLLWSAYAVSALGSEVTVLAIPLAAAMLLGASPLQMGLLTAAGFFGLMVMALYVVYLTRELDFSPVMIAAVTVSGGVGALAGAVLAPRVTARVGRGRTLLLASVVISVGMVAFPAVGGPRGLALAVLMTNEAVLMLAIMLFESRPGSFLLTVVPRGMLGRVNSSLATITQGVKPLGAIAGGALAGAFDMRPALWVAAVGTTTTVLWVWFSPLRHDRER